MKKYYASASSLTILRIILLILSIAIIYAANLYLNFIPILMWILVGIFSFIYIFVGIIWLPLYFSKLCYYVSSVEITRSTGVFVRKRQIMRISSIQYITIIKTPLSSVTGLNFIILNALGGNMFVIFLTKKDAEEISANISTSINVRRIK